MTTTTKPIDCRRVLNQGNPNEVADVLKAIKFGNMLCLWKVVAVGMTAIAAPVVGAGTNASDAVKTGARLVKAAATVTIDGVAYTLDTDELLPPIGSILGLRVDASATVASVGNYIAGPPTSTLLIPPGGANTAVGVARLSDDGTTLTFPNTITGFTLEYMARPAISLATLFPQTGLTG